MVQFLFKSWFLTAPRSGSCYVKYRHMATKKLGQQQRKRIFKWALYGLLVFIAFSIADLAIIYYRDIFLPHNAPPKKTSTIDFNKRIDRSEYTPITSRNLFSSSGLIPDPLRSNAEQAPKDDTPTLTNLPITLLGTLVHSNPDKSVAAVEVKSKNVSGSYMVGAEIEGLARLEAVQRGIIYIRNLNTQALEYAEMKMGAEKVSFDSQKPKTVSAPQTAVGEVQNLGNNQFKIKRSDLDKYLNDMSSILMQARAVPNRDPNTGEINGYRLVDFQPGSIFDQLGIPRGAVIKSAGGEPVTSIQTAMDMFNRMKKEKNVSLGIEVNGSNQTFKYDIE